MQTELFEIELWTFKPCLCYIELFEIELFLTVCKKTVLKQI